MDIGNKNIALTTFKKAIGKDEYILRLLNNSQENVQTNLTLNGESIALGFKPFEAKTIIFDGALTETEEMRI